MKLISKLTYWKHLQKLFYKVSIRQKIVFGYSLSLGIAILGTSAGLFVGDRYFQAATNETLLVNQEAILLNNLQGKMLESFLHQQEIIATLEKPETLPKEISELKSEIEELKIAFTEFKTFTKQHPETNLDSWLNKYQHDVTTYIQLVNQLITEISALALKPGDVTEKQQLMLKFYGFETVEKFSDFAHSLGNLREKIKQNQTAANLAYNRARIIEAIIIIASMIISIFIATMLALYTSKIITQPILEVTNIAKKVTQDANLDLQVVVINEDEIGELANSLNKLIQQVKTLLELQEKENKMKLIQSEKMSSLGRMLTGVAHEINNPVNFISGNLVHANNYINDLFTIIQAYQDEITDTPEKVKSIVEEIDLEFLEDDMSKVLQSMTIGAERTKEIVRSLKDFSRLDEEESQNVDIHSCLDSTLLILNNRLKNKINVVRNYGKIPQISGYTGLLYQVFMNLLSNAIDAIEENQEKNPQLVPEIQIITENTPDNSIVVKIVDNGAGITLENQKKIFENFFTTKPRGIGTGLGLAITYQIVVDKHYGKIEFDSQLEKGTEFRVYLPLFGAKAQIQN